MTQGEERWLPVPTWEGVYEVSDLGRVRSVDRVIRFKDGRQRVYRGRILKPNRLPTGHLALKLSVRPRREMAQIHALVMLAFVGPRPDGMEVCHNNGDPADNRLANLRYDTRSANLRDCVRHGNHHGARKTHCKWGHEFDERNTGRNSRGGRACRACAVINTTRCKINRQRRAAGLPPLPRS